MKILLTIVIILITEFNYGVEKNKEQSQKKTCMLEKLAGEEPEDACMIRDFLAKLPPFNPIKGYTPFRNTYLFHGHPGTGKTTGVLSLAEESGAKFFSYDMDVLLDEHANKLSSTIKEIYDNAQAVVTNEKKPVIIFFDDLKNSNQNVLDFINKYLQKYFGNPYIITIVATNREMKNFEEEFKSRCTVVLWQMPDRDKRYAIVKLYFHLCGVVYHDDFAKEVAKKTEGFTGRMLEETIERAYSIADRRGSITIDQKDVEKSFREKQEYLDQMRGRFAIFWSWLQGKRF